MEIPDLPGTLAVVVDLENSEDLGSAGLGDGSDEYTEALLDLGEVHRRNVVGRGASWLRLSALQR